MCVYCSNIFVWFWSRFHFSLLTLFIKQKLNENLKYSTLYCLYRVCDSVYNKYQPSAVVCQCGADGLYGDPMASYNLTPKVLSQCVQYVKDWGLPLLLVGGGKLIIIIYVNLFIYFCCFYLREYLFFCDELKIRN